MKLQKFLLILMSLMLVFTSTSFIALAEGEGEGTEPAAEVAVLDVNGTERARGSFADAANKNGSSELKALSGETIKLLKDITVKSSTYGYLPTAGVIIDGDNHKITTSGSGSDFLGVDVITIKNVTIESTSRIRTYGNATDGAGLTLENVTWTLTGSNKAIYVDAGGNTTAAKIEITNSTINYQADSCMIYVKGAKGADILVENSTITVASANEQVADSALIQYKAPINVKLTGNTVLNQDRKTTGTGDTYNAFFFNNGSHGTFEIDDTVTFNFNKAANQVKNSIFCSVANATYTNTVVDHGATYNISKEVLNAGFAFVSQGFGGDDATRVVDTNVIALCADGKVYNPNAKLPTDFTADVSLKAYTTSHITNSEAVADAEAETIRFPVAVDADFYAAVKDAAKFGLEIVAGTLITETGVNWTEVAGKIVDQDSSEWKWAVEGEEYAALIENINTDALKATKFAVCGFVTVTYTDGTTATFYADHSVELATSLA